MPQLSLSDALRYFFAPFALFFYMAVYDKTLVSGIQTSFGPIGLIAFLVTGSAIYFVYRYLIYDYIILWLKDIFEKDNYRRYLGRQYKLQFERLWLPITSIRAQKLYAYISYSNEKLQKDAMRIRAAGIHMLYQAGLLSLPFLVVSFLHKSYSLAALFSTFSFVFVFTAALADRYYEEEELLFLKISSKQSDEAAKLFGYGKLTASRRERAKADVREPPRKRPNRPVDRR